MVDCASIDATCIFSVDNNSSLSKYTGASVRLLVVSVTSDENVDAEFIAASVTNWNVNSDGLFSILLVVSSLDNVTLLGLVSVINGGFIVNGFEVE